MFRRRILSAAVVLSAALSVLVNPTPGHALDADAAAQPVRPVPLNQVSRDPGDGWFVLRNTNSGQVLAVAGGSDANAARVIQWPLRTQGDGQANPEQDWLFVDRLNGWWSFRNAGTADRKAMAVNGGSAQSGAAIIQWPYNPASPEHVWGFYDAPGYPQGHYQIRSYKHQNMCIAIPGASRTQGVGAVQWPCSNGPEQVWTILDN